MASSPSRRLILSPTLVCVKLQSVVAIHLIHLALDLTGAASRRCSVCDTHPSGQGPEHLGPEAHGETVWEQACPPSSGSRNSEEAKNQPVLTVPPPHH